MAERTRKLRDQLILAGIEEISLHGATEFSIRRVASACHVSCAAPYKHFKDKREFIAAIIEHVNEQWYKRQMEVLSQCSNSLRQQIVEVCTQYVVFLMEKPHYREVLMLKDNLYHKVRGQRYSTMQQLQQEFFAQAGYDGPTIRRKLLLVRSMIFGSVFLFDAGEQAYNQEAIDNLRRIIDREFDLL